MRDFNDPYANNTPKENQFFVLKICGLLIIFIAVVLGTEVNYFLAVFLTIFFYWLLNTVFTQVLTSVRSKKS